MDNGGAFEKVLFTYRFMPKSTMGHHFFPDVNKGLEKLKIL
jgi:hypothetical protein